MASYFNPISSVKEIDESYRRYIKTTFHTDVETYNQQLTEAIDSYQFVKGPFLQISDKYARGPTISELIDGGMLSREFRNLKTEKLPLDLRLYIHQYNSLANIINKDRNTVVSTGTGSGKTESFLIPIFNHLMREVEEGTIEKPGVRAMIVYPMNALVNDQMDRMSDLLENYPNITFGFFTGETKEQETAEDFKKRFGREPLENEMYTRERMRVNPPHILITNYSMLEHILILPENSVEIFNPENRDKWKYIVLDEVHTYGGAKGSEVSLLLKRVQTTIGSDKIRFILTSATLGSGPEADSEVADFATALTSQRFEECDVIRASKEDYITPESVEDVSIDFYREVLSEYENGGSIPADAWMKVRSDIKYWQIIDAFKIKKGTVLTLEELSEKTNIATDDLIAIVNACTLIRDPLDNKMFDARYHTFIRSLDGVYFTLAPSCRISLTKSSKLYDEKLGQEMALFVMSTCYNCNAIYIPGKCWENHLLNLDSNSVYDPDNMDGKKKLFLLSKEDEFEPGNDQFFTVCSKCRTIWGRESEPLCSCGEEYWNLLKEVVPSEKGNICRCHRCGQINNKFGIVRDYYLGDDAASAVIATSLYNTMPKPLQKTKPDDPDPVKQFLLFSDSRKSASFAAVNLEDTYENLLMHRTMKDLVCDDWIQIMSDEETFESFRKGFKEKIEGLVDGLNVEKNELIEATSLALLKELVASNSNKSLEYMGLISFEYDFKNPVPSLSSEDSNALLNTMLKIVREKGAIKDHITRYDVDKIYVHNQGIIEKVKTTGSSVFLTERVKKYLAAIIPDDKERDEVIDSFFREECFSSEKFGSKRGYSVIASKLLIRSHNIIYECTTCKKHYPYSVKSICPHCCRKTLVAIEPPIKCSDNHYATLYRDMPMEWLEIREHTAQLDREKLNNHQKQFKNQKLNALSCSTTFEMGIDIGTLSYIFLKNVPPTPSNYAQRAGRAGRSKNSSAFILTFCKNGSHDHHYFDAPQEMITGDIATPRINPSNPKIAIRHIFASAIGFYWKSLHESPEKFHDMTCQTYLDSFRDFLDSHNEQLTAYLDKIVPSDIKDYRSNELSIDLENFGWVDTLLGENGRLTVCAIEFRNDISLMEERRDEYCKQKNLPVAQDYDRTIANLNSIDVLSGLSRGNVIPRYGFPVDTVSLQPSRYINKGEEDRFDLQRDMSMGIAEYAPDCQIVANRRLITSTHLKKVQGKERSLYKFGKCPECQTAFLERIADPSEEPMEVECPNCHIEVNLNENLTVPEFGFIYTKNEKATINKPRRSHGINVYYKGESQPNVMSFEIGSMSGRLSINTDDELVVESRDKYYICNKCGYGFSNKCGYGCTRSPPKEHTNDFGEKCKGFCSLMRLGHVFRTDVAIIHFDIAINDRKTALSTLYALIEGLCLEIQVERNEISGCIRKLNDGTYDFILFDNTPGGSGYVKSIKIDLLPRIVDRALSVVSSCDCGGPGGDDSCYRCLRSYYNQQYHDELKRGLAISALSKIKELMGNQDGHIYC